jgi:hypothetical protein
MKLKILLMLTITLLDVAFCLPLLRAGESSQASLTAKSWIAQFRPARLWSEKQANQCVLQGYRY